MKDLQLMKEGEALYEGDEESEVDNDSDLGLCFYSETTKAS